MDALQLGAHRGARRLNDATTLLPGGDDALHDLGTLDALGMARRWTMVCKPIGVNED
jgi:hypothetical protein